MSPAPQDLRNSVLVFDVAAGLRRGNRCYVHPCTGGAVTEQLANRDLRNHSAELLREAAAGASHEITNHGEVVALLTPPAPDGRLRVRRATSRRTFSEIRRVRRNESVGSALEDPHGNRLTLYLDASAAEKLLVDEAESDVLFGYLDETVDGQDLVSSALLETELRHLAVRLDLDQSAVC